MSKRERLFFVVSKGMLAPADAYTLSRLREKGYKLGDIVAAELTKPRNPAFWRLAHRLGTMCVENIEPFSRLDAHRALKKLQFDANIECEETDIEIPGLGVLKARKPRSLSFDLMDQVEFYAVMKAMCRHISATYWPNLSEDAVAQMAGCMLEEA